MNIITNKAMKIVDLQKILIMICTLMGWIHAVKAATVDDIVVCKNNYVLCFDDWNGNGTAKPGKGQLFGNGYFLDVTGGSVSTSKGIVNLSVLNEADDNHVTQYIVDTYGADYPDDHNNSWRLKNAQDMIAMKVMANSKLIFFLQGNGQSGINARIPKISQKSDLSDPLNAAPGEDHPATDAGFRYEWIAPEDMTIYIGSYNGDTFFSYLIVEVGEVPGTPTVKIGAQTYENGLWFREVTCTANPVTEEGSAEEIPTIVTYTTDGTFPTAESSVYTEPIKCYQNMTVRFQSFLDFGDGKPSDYFVCDGAEVDAGVNFNFNAPTIEVDGANFTIVSEYEGQGATNFYAIDGNGAIAGNSATLAESAVVSAYTEIANGIYGTFTSNPVTKDVYVLNALNDKETIEVTAGDVILVEDAPAALGEVYMLENGEIGHDNMKFFINNAEFAVVTEPEYQAPDGNARYIKMNNTRISFKVAANDLVRVKVTCSKNSCKMLDNENETKIDRKCYVNVNGTNYGNDDITAENGNIIEFELKGGTEVTETDGEGVDLTEFVGEDKIYTFQKYSGTGNILVAKIEFEVIKGGATNPVMPYAGTPTFERENNLLTIKSSTSLATIYYTLDDSTPTTSSTLYTNPITLTKNCTVKAIAVADGYENSEVATYVVDWFRTDASVVWSFNTSSSTPATMIPSELFSGSSVTVEGGGSESAEMPYAGENSGFTFVSYSPSLENGTMTVRWTANIVNGKSFTPNKIGLRMERFGTNNGKVNLSIYNSEGESMVLATGLIPARDNQSKEQDYHGNEEGYTTLYESDINSNFTTTGSFTLEATIENTDLEKKIGFCDVRFYGTTSTLVDKQKCVEPYFSVDGATLTIKTTTPESTIYYTTDNSNPTTASQQYTQPITLEHNCVVKAFAVRDGWTDSEVSVYNMVFYKVEKPVISVIDNQATITTSTNGAQIYYTMDGTIPTAESELYTAPITLRTKCVLKAIAIKEDYRNSDLTTYTNLATDKGQWYFNAGLSETTKENLKTETSGRWLYDSTADRYAYQNTLSEEELGATVNGSEWIIPETEGLIFTNANTTPGRVVFVESSSRGAYLLMMGNYGHITIPNVPAKESVTIIYSTHSSGSSRGFEIETSDVATRDGSTSVTSLVMDTVTIYNNNSDTQNIKIAPKGIELYYIGIGPNFWEARCATPVIAAKNNKIGMSCSTPESVIYYTLDGTDPTRSSNQYTDSLTITRNCAVRAVAVAEGYNDSEVATYTVDWFKVADVMFVQTDTQITLSTVTEDATVYYRLLSGEEAFVEYEQPLLMTGDCTIEAFASRDGYNNSDTVRYEFVAAGVTVATPQIAHNGNKIGMSTTTEQAVIHYTLDGTTPTAESTVYADSITVERNLTVKAMAVRDNWFDSKVDSLVVNWFKVADVTFVQNGNQVTLSTETEGATIHYTLSNNSEADEQVYTSPLVMTGDCTITAWATRDGYAQSETTGFVFHAGGVTCSNPVFAHENGTNVVTVSTATDGATIHYTTDGTEPTGESEVFPVDGLTVSRNMTIKAIALRENYYPSQVTTFNVDWFKVLDVVFAFKSQHLEMTTETADADIYYTTDGTVPTVENIETACTKYEAPISLDADCTVRAIAICDGYTPSDVATYPFVVANVTVATPEISVTDGIVTMVCPTDGTTIYYTLDGTAPTTESLRYDEPFAVTGNAIIKAFAVHADFLPSAIGEYSISDMFKADVPTFVRNGNVLTIQAAEGDQIHYAFEDGDYMEYTAPVMLTDNRTVSAYATRSGYLPSDVATYTVDWFACADVQVGYNGRNLTLSSMDGAAIYYTLDESEPTVASAVYDQPISLSGFATVKAMAVMQYMNPSAVTTYEVPSYYDGAESVEVRIAGMLSAAFGWLDPSEMPEKLTITGSLNQDDLRFLRSINGLRHLNLSGANMTGGRLPDAAFANMNVISIEIPVSITGTGSNLFIGCTRLAAIVWGAGIAATEEAMSGLNNPNLLFYVNRKVYAPQSIRNVVTDGVAQNIELSDAETDGNFYCPRYFFAERISYVHNFTLESGKNKMAAGWESLALPFDVQKVEHEENGILVPFTVYNNLSSDEKEVTKPYWLYTMDSEGSAFKPTERIVANTPYIICMPNNADYADNYNQRGNVTFSAQGINVAPTELKPMEHGTVRFVPCFEHIAQSSTVSLLNTEAIGTYLPGSVFYPNQRDARPFEAYIMDVIQPNYMMRVFDNNDTGIDVFPMLRHSVVFENEKVYSLDGQRVKTPGKGVYIVNGKKRLVK